METASGILLVIVCIAYLYWQRRRRDQLPPGPWAIPFLGSVPYLRQDLYRQCQEFSHTYGGMFTIYFGSRPAVVITDWKILKEAFVKQSSIFAARPRSDTVRSIYGNKDIAFADLQYWKQLRPFAIRHLKDLGFGRISVETNILNEAEKIVEHLKSVAGTKVTIDRLFSISLLNIAWQIVAGCKFELTDPRVSQLIHNISMLSDIVGKAAILDVFPILRYLFPGKFPVQQGRECSLSADNLLFTEIQNHKKNLEVDNPLDFIDIFLAEIHRRGGFEKQQPPFDEEHLVGSIRDLFFAGLETTDTALSWAILFAAKYPRIQQNLQDEIDLIVGRNRLPDCSDQKNLPYLMAFLMEVNRFATVAPLAAPHETVNATHLCGYELPKGTMIIPNLWAVHRDPTLWGDPDHFRPERFLDDQGKYKEPEYVIPFSLGPRVCIGEKLARMQFFLVFSVIMQNFSFEFPMDEPEPSTKEIPALTIRPPAYSVIPRYR